VTQALAADGSTIWQVTTGTGTRWLRLRKSGPPLDLPDSAVLETVTLAEADDLAAAAPPYLRQLWRLAEAAPAWGWTLRQLPGGTGAAVVGWFLSVEKPDGTEARFTWVDRGGRMHLVAQTEAIRAVRTQLGGP
jgi:hypothetical protein